MKSDIRNRDDIRVMVDAFYVRVKNDALLAPIFLEKIPGDWSHHLDIMYRFWNAALFQVREYTGNPFMKHMTLPLQQIHFERWIDLFYQTIDEHFVGAVADEAKRRAMIMAHTFYKRMNVHTDPHPLPNIRK
jgi:hemoglobin